MSSREPLWFCHECHAEMRPLMVPDPICASCRGSFVEKMENPSDDPREFAHPDAAGFGSDGVPPGIDTFLFALQGMMDRGAAEGRSQTPRGNGVPGNRVTFQIRTGGSPRPNTLDGSGRVPTMSEFLRRGSETPDGPTITGPIMAQYLMALLGQRDPLSELFERGMSDTPGEHGRMGDYVFNQEALDHIITQLMENSNSHRPVPATEEIISNLPREVLEVESPTLEKDCAVCKEQFKLQTDDPDEQVVLTLPCKHPFHEPCILPWLKSSGTCPVCRYALVPQPEHHPPPGPGPDSGRPRSRPGSPSARSRSPRPRSSDHGTHDPNGILQSLFGGIVGGRSGNSFGSNTGSSSGHHRSNSDPNAHPSDLGTNPRSNLPGGWNEDLD